MVPDIGELRATLFLRTREGIGVLTDEGLDHRIEIAQIVLDDRDGSLHRQACTSGEMRE